MIKTYRHFKKHSEILWGLNVFSLIKLSLNLLFFIYLIQLLHVSLDSNFFLLLSIIGVSISAFIIKSDRDYEISGFYTSFLTHPFNNHIFPFSSSNEQYPKEDAYLSIEKLQNLAKIGTHYLVDKEASLISIIEIEKGVSVHSLENSKKEEIILAWGNFLCQVQALSENSHCSLQSFSFIENSSQDPDDFVPKYKFYLIIKQGRTKQIHPCIKIAFKLVPQLFKTNPHVYSDNELTENLKLLEQKIHTAEQLFISLNSSSKILEGQSLEGFCQKFSIYTQKQTQSQTFYEDSSIHIVKHAEQKEYSKTYRVKLAPENGNLNFWLAKYLLMIKSKAYISVHYIPRDASKDRRKAEHKAELTNQFNKTKHASTISIIEENKAIANDLVQKPYSYDIAILITLLSDDLKRLEELDLTMRSPVNAAVLSTLARQQVDNWLYSLPFAHCKLKNRDLLFANHNFAQSCFNYCEDQVGTDSGPQLGFALNNNSPVFLDESDKQHCHNRSINFIGDSGSGKSVCAKLALKQRLGQNRKFIIIDHTQDGWHFFVKYFAGQIIEVDQLSADNNSSSFAPFRDFGQNHQHEKSQQQLNKLVKLLSLLKSNPEAISNPEISFLQESLGILAQSSAGADIDKLILLWSQTSKSKNPLLKNFPKDLIDEWIYNLKPFSSNGIYAGLMDKNESNIQENAELILFNFSQTENSALFNRVSLHLINNFVEDLSSKENNNGIYLVIDESWKLLSNKLGEQLLSGWARMGRARNLGLWSISQKPQDLSRAIHSNASSSICFQLKEQADQNEMGNLSSLNPEETKFLASPEIKQAGVCMLKTSKSSGLLRIKLSKQELSLCNSSKDFCQYRNKIFKEIFAQITPSPLAESKAAQLTVEKLSKELKC